MDIDRAALTNIKRFNETVSRSHGKNRGSQREYRVLLNCKTGEMNFQKSIRDLEHSLSSMKASDALRLMDVRLIVIDREDGPSTFVLRDDQDRILESPDDQGVVKKTLEMLNSQEEITDLPGWVGSLSIDEAEKKLEGAPVGTYLIRSGDEVSYMVDEMEEKYGKIVSYSLLFASEEERVSEKLILHVSWGWIVQEDEPNLRSPSYTVFPTAKKLLESLGAFISKPVFVTP